MKLQNKTNLESKKVKSHNFIDEDLKLTVDGLACKTLKRFSLLVLAN